MKYPALFEPAEEGGFVVTFPDVEEAVTQGEDEQDAREMARDALITMFAYYIRHGKPIPPSSHPRGERYRMIALPLLQGMKIELYQQFLASGIRKSALATRLGIPKNIVDRLFDLQHRSRIGRLWRGTSDYRWPVSKNLLSNRTCGFPAYGLTMVFWMWRACRRRPEAVWPFNGASLRLLPPSPTAPSLDATWRTPIVELLSCRAFTEGLLAVTGMPSRLPVHRHGQSRVPSLQRVLLHAFSGSTDPSDSLPALLDFSRPALYEQSLPDADCRVGPLLFRALLSKRATTPTPGRSNSRSDSRLLSIAFADS